MDYKIFKIEVKNMMKIVYNLVIIAMLLAVMASPSMAAEDDVIFSLTTIDGSNEISLQPDEEITIYLNADAPYNKTGGFEVAIMFDPNIFECLGVTENETVTNWMA